MTSRKMKSTLVGKRTNSANVFVVNEVYMMTNDLKSNARCHQIHFSWKKQKTQKETSNGESGCSK
jgi:hypothetical protein